MHFVGAGGASVGLRVGCARWWFPGRFSLQAGVGWLCGFFGGCVAGRLVPSSPRSLGGRLFGMKEVPVWSRHKFYNPATMTQILIAESNIKALLISAVPDLEWLIGEIESEGGWIRFPPFLTNAVTNLKIENYPLLYESEPALTEAILRSFLTPEQIREIAIEFEQASPEQRGEWLVDFSVGVDSGLRDVRIPRTQAEQDAARERFESLSKEERDKAVRFGQHFYSYFFSNFYQNLSLMVHGEKLTSLVAQAKTGNDDAFVKAIQIDRRILTVIPYFKDRYAKAQAEGHEDFYDKLSYRLARPPFKGKIRYKSLWMTFAILDGAGLLSEMTHSKILRLCDEAGVGGYKNRIEDVKYLSKRIKEYREFQRRGLCVVP